MRKKEKVKSKISKYTLIIVIVTITIFCIETVGYAQISSLIRLGGSVTWNMDGKLLITNVTRTTLTNATENASIDSPIPNNTICNNISNVITVFNQPININIYSLPLEFKILISSNSLKELFSAFNYHKENIANKHDGRFSKSNFCS